MEILIYFAKKMFAQYKVTFQFRFARPTIYNMGLNE